MLASTASMRKIANFSTIFGFTLAEVLITLGIIGVVAAMTIPVLLRSSQDAQFKSAYKKAYSEASGIWREMAVNNELTYCTGPWDNNCALQNFIQFKTYIKIVEDCGIVPTQSVKNCWSINGEGFNQVQNSGNGIPNSSEAGGFAYVDNSGRSWMMVIGAYWNELQLMVDTNGFNQPNKFGKDRWVFWGSPENGVSPGMPTKLAPSPDRSVVREDCGYPNCYGTSWLLNN